MKKEPRYITAEVHDLGENNAGKFMAEYKTALQKAKIPFTVDDEGGVEVAKVVEKRAMAIVHRIVKKIKSKAVRSQKSV